MYMLHLIHLSNSKTRKDNSSFEFVKKQVFDETYY